MKWKYFPRYWPFVQGIHRFPVNSPHRGQWRGALMFSLICTWINGWVDNGVAGDLIRHHAHYDVTVMTHMCSKSHCPAHTGGIINRLAACYGKPTVPDFWCDGDLFVCKEEKFMKYTPKFMWRAMKSYLITTLRVRERCLNTIGYKMHWNVTSMYMDAQGNGLMPQYTWIPPWNDASIHVDTNGNGMMPEYTWIPRTMEWWLKTYIAGHGIMPQYIWIPRAIKSCLDTYRYQRQWNDASVHMDTKGIAMMPHSIHIDTKGKIMMPQHMDTKGNGNMMPHCMDSKGIIMMPQYMDTKGNGMMPQYVDTKGNANMMPQ